MILSFECGPAEAYISDVAVKPDFQRQGIGRQLLEAAEALACSHGKYSLYAAPIFAWEQFEKLGFDIYTNDGYARKQLNLPTTSE